MHIEVETPHYHETVTQFKKLLMKTLNLDACILRIEYINAKKSKDLSFFILGVYDIKTQNYAFWPNVFVKKDALILFLRRLLGPYKVALGFLKGISDASSSYKLSAEATSRTGCCQANTDGDPNKQGFHSVVQGLV
jgi:hypothetical protein